MNLEQAIKILINNDYIVESIDYCFCYKVTDECGENIAYGKESLTEEEVIDYVKCYII